MLKLNINVNIIKLLLALQRTMRTFVSFAKSLRMAKHLVSSSRKTGKIHELF